MRPARSRILAVMLSALLAAAACASDREPATRYDLAVALAPVLRRAEPLDGFDLAELAFDFEEQLRAAAGAVDALTLRLDELRADVRRIERRERRERRTRRVEQAGVHGLLAVRLVRTGANGPAGAAGNVGSRFQPLTRYAGRVRPTATGFEFDTRTFFTLPQLSLSWSRSPDRGFGARVQLDFDADAGASLEPGQPADTLGKAVQVNEAYLTVRDAPFGFDLRLGQFALPLSPEFDGSHRSLDSTITPSAIGARLESYRGQGVELRNSARILPWDIRAGVVSGLNDRVVVPAVPRRSDSLLADALTVAALNGTPVARTSGRPFTDRPVGTASRRRTVPRPGAAARPASLAFSAVEIGVGEPELSFYARVADEPDQGFGWALNFLSNGGNVPHVLDVDKGGITAAEFASFTGTLTYRTPAYDLVVQVYEAASKNSSTQGAVPNPLSDPTISTGAFALATWRFTAVDQLALRVEQNRDEVESVGAVDVSAATACWRRAISARSLFQLEVLVPRSRTTTNDTDADDSLVQANYKLAF